METIFPNLMQKVSRAIDNRTIKLSPKKATKFEAGMYNPFFSLLDRDGELLCMFCGNRRKPNAKGEGGDIEILRIRKPEDGLSTDIKDPAGWNKVTGQIYRYYKPILGDKFEEWANG